MNELQILVQQEPGVIKWNFEDLKNALLQEMEERQSVIYTDDTITDAKKDIAALRKLKDAVDDRRKEIKNKCLEPYYVIDAQASELKDIIQKPIDLINKQVQEYEERRRAEVKKKIMRFMIETFSDLPAEISKKAQLKIYDTRWENKTTKESEWKAAITAAMQQISTALQVIAGVDADFREEAMRVYSINLSLPDTMAKVQEMQRQKEIILERQRQKEEQERRRQEAEAAAKAQEEARRTQQAAQAHDIEEKSSQEEQPVNYASETHNNEFLAKQMERGNREAQEFQKPIEIHPNCTVIRLIDATDAQVKKITDYIKFMGVKFECQG